MLQQIFHREVERQCTCARIAYEDVKQALALAQQPSLMPPTVNAADATQMQEWMVRHDQWQAALAQDRQMRAAANDRFWYAVQAFLVAAGNISKLLWPSDTPRLPERGPDLRASLEVDDDSPLKSRTLRTPFEHVDARLEQWAVLSKHHSLIDANIAPAGMLTVSGAEPGDYFRNFDLTEFAVTFWGKSYCLPPIADAIERLWHKVTVWLQQHASA
jgi:hypothetical protein